MERNTLKHDVYLHEWWILTQFEITPTTITENHVVETVWTTGIVQQRELPKDDEPHRDNVPTTPQYSTTSQKFTDIGGKSKQCGVEQSGH